MFDKYIVFNLPNIITFARILLLPFFIYLLIFNTYTIKTVLLFLIIITTDILDGMIARMRRQVSEFGSFIDPIADKLLFIPTFLIFFLKDVIHYSLFFVYIIRELIILIGWVIAYTKKKNIKTVVRVSGKIFCVTEAVFVFLLLTRAGKEVINYVSVIFVVIICYSLLDHVFSNIKISRIKGVVL